MGFFKILNECECYRVNKEIVSGTSYLNIVKSTFLFGFVQVFRAVAGVVKNKLLAVFVGPEGTGLVSVFTTASDMIKIGAGLGVSQSTIRDISEAYSKGDVNHVTKILSVSQRLFKMTGILGCLFTLLFSSNLSYWMLKSEDYTLHFSILSIYVFFSIITEGQYSVLTGMRKLKDLAKANLFGVSVGLLTSVPLYYFYGLSGIIPSFLLSSIAIFGVSKYYVRKCRLNLCKITWNDFFSSASSMLKMGISLMFVSFLHTIVAFIITSYMGSHGGLNVVGYYGAGTIITNAYFGIIITALSTDYFPRISSVISDNQKLTDELNRQASVSLVMVFPLLLIFIFFMPLFVEIIYSDEYFPALDYLKYAIYGTLITICSNQVDMILVAKYEIKLFMIISIIFRLLQLVLSVILFKNYSLEGLGFAVMIMGILHLVAMVVSVKKLYNVMFDKFFIKLFSIVLISTMFASIVSTFSNIYMKYGIGSILIFFSLIFSLYIMKKKFSISMIKFIK